MRTAFFQSDSRLSGSRRLRSLFLRYAAALSIVAVAVLLRLWLNPVLGQSGFAISLVAMLLAAWVGGLGPCLIAQTLILFADAYWFSREHRLHSPSTLQGIISLTAFYSVGGIVAVLSEAWKAARHRAQMERDEAVSQREQLRTTVSCIADAVFVTDAKARLVLMNPAAEALTGWSWSESSGRSVRDIFAVYDEAGQQLAENPIQRVLREDTAIHHSLRLLVTTRNDRRIPVSYSAAPVRNVAGETWGIVLVFRDETERLRTERALKLADKRKDEFLATLAHELRNPLAPICMGLELLQDAAGDEEMAEEVRSMMTRQTRHMVRLIDDLLDISRITRGKLELQKSVTALSEVVQNAVDATRCQFEELQHQLAIQLPQNEVHLYADPNRLSQVLTNLLSNAAKYTPAGGRISLDVQRKNGDVMLSVADNGCGIPSDRLESVFDMFSQVEGAKQRGHQGLGIGLNLVKRLVEMHGGTVTAESKGLDHGSRFTVRLPLSQPQPPAGPQKNSGIPAAPNSVATCRVLVVDDNQDARTMLSRKIQLWGYEVQEAEDGHQAVATADAFRPHVVLMDIGMPGLDGYEAARRIRQEPWGEDMVLAATTGWGQAEDRRRSQEAGFDHHLVKPIDETALLELIGSAAAVHAGHNRPAAQYQNMNGSAHHNGSTTRQTCKVATAESTPSMLGDT